MPQNTTWLHELSHQLRKVMHLLCALLFLLGHVGATTAQSVGNYTATRSTGETYTSIASSGQAVSSWRLTGGYSQDDNRSDSVDIGFDFWYAGIRYTTFSVSPNGYLDFSSSTDDGGATADDFGYSNAAFTQSNVANATRPALAVFYDDMTAQGGTDPLGESIKYLVEGEAPNRTLTVEWINMAVYGNTTPDLNFQIVLFETTGEIYFNYGTMSAGTHTFSYTLGINNTSMNAAPTTAQLLTQQTANTGTFSNTVQNNLTAMPEADSRIKFTPPTPTGAPSGFSATGITQTGMTLNWTDNSSNEQGFVIYYSTDDVSYLFNTQTAANAVTQAITGLAPSTTYYWKIYAVSEGKLSSALSGNATTSAAGTKNSNKATGNWNTAADWTPSGVPTAGDNVTIQAGHTYTLNTTAAVCNDLTISGTFQLGNNNTPRTLNVGGDVSITSTGIFRANTASNTTHVVNINNGDVNNDGTLNFASDGNSFAQLNFKKNGDQTFSGSGATTVIKSLTLAMGTSASNVLTVTTDNFTQATGGNFLTITSGTFYLNSSNTTTLDPYTATLTLNSDEGIHIDNPNVTVNFGASITLSGAIQVSNGTVNIGNAADENLIMSGGTLTVDGGTVNIAGRYYTPDINQVSTFIMTAGTLTLPTSGSTSTTISPLNVNSAGSTFNLSGGTVVIQREGGGGTQNLGISISDGDFDISGGTFQIGNASTPAGQQMNISSVVSFPNFTINSANAIANVTSNLTVSGNVTITAGTLALNATTLTVSGNWNNTGTFTPGTSTVAFDGSTDQTITKASGETFYNLTNNKAAGLLISSADLSITGTLAMTSGVIDPGSNTITLGTSVGSPGTLSYIAGLIDGKFKRWISSTGTPYTFPLGSGNNYLGAVLNFTNLTTGTLTTEFVSTDPASNGLPILDAGKTISDTYSEGYWTFAAGDGLTSNGYSAVLNANGFSSYSVSSSTRILTRTDGSSPWLADGTHVAGGSTYAERSAITTMPCHLSLAKPGCSAYTATTITGSSSVCTNTTGEAYSVTSNALNTYSWTPSLGTQASGSNTASITIDWGAIGGEGSVQVVEQNDCGDNNTPIILTVDVHPLPISSITGSASVSANSTGSAYSVTDNAGYTYTWTIVGGTTDPNPASGQGSSSILVDWGAAGAGSVSVSASGSCGSPASQNLPVTIKTTIVSAGTGNWATGGTWVGGVAPVSGDIVEIASGHIVTMNGNPGACTQLTINGTANWTNSYTTNVGSGGVIISATGNITGTVNGSLTSTGGLTINNSLTSSTVGITLQTTADQTINGTGTLPKLTINANTINEGSVTATSLLAGSATLTNAATGTLNINCGTFTLTGLNASASGNTVSYGRSGAQTIKSTSYHHLTLGGSGTKSLTSAATIAGDLTISGTATLDVTTSNFGVTVGGDWTNSSTYNPRYNITSLNGDGAQAIFNASGETFYTLNTSGSGTKTFTHNATINANFNNSGSVAFGTATIYLKGNFSNTGSLDPGTSTLQFTGTVAQTLGGSATTSLYHLTINNTSGGVALSGDVAIENTLTLNNGTLTVTGHDFTLLSTASLTARIAQITGGSISGSIHVQRYVGGTYGWKILSSPVTGGLLSDWGEEFLMAGFPGCTYTSGESSVFFYDETVGGISDYGFTEPTNIGDAVVPGLGYFAWVQGVTGKPFPATLEITGTANTGPVPVSAGYTSNVDDNEDGWNLIGNPLPSDIVWDNVALSGGMSNNAYIWDAASSSFLVYDHSSGDVIASHQGFWVKTNGGPGTLTFDEADKTGAGTTFYKTTSTPRVMMSLQGNGYTSKAQLKFIPGATTELDQQGDAHLLPSLNTSVANLFTLSADSARLVYNCLPENPTSIDIPLGLLWTASGASPVQYTLNLDSLDVPYDGFCMYLEDTKLDSVIHFSEGTTYAFTEQPSVTPAHRFVIHISSRANIQSTDQTCTYNMDGSVTLQVAEGQTWESTITSEDGQTHPLPPFTGTTVLSDLNPGVYLVYSENTSGLCPGNLDTVIIDSAAELNASIYLQDETLEMGDTLIAWSDGNGSVTQQWFMDGTPIGNDTSLSYPITSSGNYTLLLVTQNAACSDSDAVTVVVNSIVSTPQINADQMHLFVSRQSTSWSLSSATTLSGVQYRLTSLAGSVVATGSSELVGPNNPVYLSGMAPGIYLMELVHSRGKVTAKIPLLR